MSGPRKAEAELHLLQRARDTSGLGHQYHRHHHDHDEPFPSLHQSRSQESLNDSSMIHDRKGSVAFLDPTSG